MKRYLLTLLLLAIFLPLFPEQAIAQVEELEPCQNYYQFGEVKVNLNTKKSFYTKGEKVELFGTIVNQNSFPLLNITIFAHLKRTNEESYLENGHFLVDKLTLAQNLNFLPKETKDLFVFFPVKDNYQEGEYQLQYFVFSKDGFYYSGRPFLEEDFAGVSNFEISNRLGSEVFFDLNSLRLDGLSQKIRDYIAIFGPGENPLIEIDLKDLRMVKSDLSIGLRWYRWDDSFEENLVKTERYQFFANREPTFQTIFDLPDPGAYVLYLEIVEPASSLFKFRIARRGEKAYSLRMNDLGITNYPVDPQKDRAFVCFHSPSEENSPLTRVTLSLFDKNGAVLEQKTAEDSFSGEVMALSISLTKLSDPLNFSLQADFEDLENPSLSQTVRNDYDCHLFNESLTSLDASFQKGRVDLKKSNLCGSEPTTSFAEKLIIYKNGQIREEQYNLKPIPSEIDTSSFPAGDYKLILKSGQFEKEMDFTVGRKTSLVRLLTVVLIAVVAFLLYYLKKRRLVIKAKEVLKESKNEK